MNFYQLSWNFLRWQNLLTWVHEMQGMMSLMGRILYNWGRGSKLPYVSRNIDGESNLSIMKLRLEPPDSILSTFNSLWSLPVRLISQPHQSLPIFYIAWLERKSSNMFHAFLPLVRKFFKTNAVVTLSLNPLTIKTWGENVQMTPGTSLSLSAILHILNSFHWHAILDLLVPVLTCSL